MIWENGMIEPNKKVGSQTCSYAVLEAIFLNIGLRPIMYKENLFRITKLTQVS